MNNKGFINFDFIALILIIFVLIVLFAGEPDLMDIIINILKIKYAR